MRGANPGDASLPLKLMVVLTVVVAAVSHVINTPPTQLALQIGIVLAVGAVIVLMLQYLGGAST